MPEITLTIGKFKASPTCVNSATDHRTFRKFIPEESKDVKYYHTRKRNNLAAKRSRDKVMYSAHVLHVMNFTSKLKNLRLRREVFILGLSLCMHRLVRTRNDVGTRLPPLRVISPN
jgi:hypothetical protein